MASSLVDEILGYHAEIGRRDVCTVCAMPAQYREAIEQAHELHGVGAKTLATICARWGYPEATHWKLTRHLMGQCRERRSTKS